MIEIGKGNKVKCTRQEKRVTARFFVILFSIILCVFMYACM